MTATEQVREIAKELDVDLRHILTGTAILESPPSFSLKGPQAECGDTAAHDTALVAALRGLATAAAAVPKEDDEDPGEQLGKIAGGASGKLFYPQAGCGFSGIVLEVPGGAHIRDADAEKLLARLRELGSVVEALT